MIHRGVRCKTKGCGNRIDVSPLVVSDRGFSFDGMVDKVIELHCKKCEKVHLYGDLDLVCFEAPPGLRYRSFVRELNPVAASLPAPQSRLSNQNGGGDAFWHPRTGRDFFEVVLNFFRARG